MEFPVVSLSFYDHLCNLNIFINIFTLQTTENAKY